MAEERPLIEEVLDYVVYAPVGAAMQVAKALPDLVDAGRKRVGSTFNLARVLGEFAVGTARRRFEQVLGGGTAGQVDVQHQDVVLETVSSVERSPRRAASPPLAESLLAIPGYDSLAASQVVARLAGLSDSELEQVRAYESGRRARRTILARIAQLTEDRNASS